MIAAAVSFLALFGLYLHGLSPGVALEDAGELLRAATSLSPTHPPGYPLWVAGARLVILLPIGDPGFRAGLFSAICTAAGCVIAAGALSGPGLFARAIGAAILGTGVIVWWQASIPEKYSLTLLLCAIALRAAVRCARRDRPPARGLAVLGLAAGAAAAHHAMAVALLPALVWAAVLGLRRARITAVRAVLLAAFFVLLPLSLRPMFTAIRGGTAVGAAAVGGPVTAGRLAEYAGGAPYRWRLFHRTAGDAIIRLVRHAISFPPRDLGWAGMILAVIGFASLLRQDRSLALAFAGTAAAGFVFCAGLSHERTAVETWHLPAFAALAALAAAGVIRLVRVFDSRPPVIRLAAMLAVGMAVVAPVPGRQAECARDRVFLGLDFARNVLDWTPAGAVLVAHTDHDLFPLWYAHDVLGLRPDVTIVDADFAGPAGPDATASDIRLRWPAGTSGPGTLAHLLARGEPPAVRISAVIHGMERLPLAPAGAAWRIAISGAALAREDGRGELRRWRRARRIRGAHDGIAPWDERAQALATLYVMGDYRRGVALLAQRHPAEAQSAARSALAVPPWRGIRFDALRDLETRAAAARIMSVQ